MLRAQPLTEENKALLIFSIFRAMPKKEYVKARSICRTARKVAQTMQLGPYNTKASFVMAFTGQFYNNNKLIAHLEDSYNYYLTILSSSKDLPAAIYKLRESPFHSDENIKSFNANEDAYQNGRIYYPQKHTWSCNEVWLVANIQLGRSFIIFADISVENMTRKNNPSAYSAFAREIAAAVKVGYRARILDNGQIRLDPPDNQVSYLLQVEDIRCENAEIEESYACLQLFSMYALRTVKQDGEQRLSQRL